MISIHYIFVTDKPHKTKNHLIHSYGVIFMFRLMRLEWCTLQKYIRFIVGISFCTTFGGVLLWVNGSAAPIVFRATNIPTMAPGFTVFFLLWLVLYALTGMKIGCTFLLASIFRYKSLLYTTGECIAYILLLAWYPLFFSVVHCFFSIVVLSISAVLQICLLFSRCRKFYICIPITLLQILMEVYFILISISYMLIN